MNKLIREIARFIYMESKYTWDDLSEADKQYLSTLWAHEQEIYKSCGVFIYEEYHPITEIKKLIPCFFKEG